MKLRPLSTAALVLLACACAHLPRGERIGEPLRSTKVLHFAEVAADPALYADRTLLVEGTVTAVCQKAGCWMQIEDGGHTALVRWETGCGGRFTFPKDAAGRRAVVQGSLYPKEISPEDLEHLREEAGASVEIPTDGYEINASAVVLLED
jgi:hypothetical protein